MLLAAMGSVDLARPPYCGIAPLPEEIAGRWNLDPALLAVLAAGLVGYRLAAPRGGSSYAFLAGWAVLAVAFVSPLCSLGVALFSARVMQHLLLSLLAAPLLVAGLAAPASPAVERGATRPASAAWLWAGCFAVIFWFWHAPGPYAATFRSPTAYWAMHASILVSACALWRAMASGAAARPFAVLLLGLATSLQLGALGALLCFAPAPLYAPHLASTAAWGLTALADQQLGGLFCWIPGCAVFLLAGLAPVAAWLRECDARGLSDDVIIAARGAPPPLRRVPG
jgi:putative membrane protein